MRIDYASSAMDAQDFANLFENSPKAPGQQAQKFNRLMIQGLAENGAVVRAVTARPCDWNKLHEQVPLSQ